jgi:general stress protein 26
MVIKFQKSLSSILIILFVATFLLLTPEGNAQTNKLLSRDSLLIAARNIINSSTSHAFITVDENGKPQAREMSPFPPENNWVIWLGTSQGSRKSKQIQNNPNVIVYYSDPQSWSYVSFAGTARLVNDPDKKAKYWVEGWERYYPDREKNYILIEVTPLRIEVVSIKNNILWNSQGAAQSVDFVQNPK